VTTGTSNFESLTIAFYNIENLFDIYDDKRTNDNDFLPTSDKRWTQKRYDRKIYKLGAVISKIGFNVTGQPPAIIGLAEVENKKVIQDLLESEDLKEYHYKYVHFDSNDERGIDVALLYNDDLFKVLSSEIFTVLLEDDDGNRDFTRDILLVSGSLNGEDIHVVVNHWPSRREGEKESAPKRFESAKKANEVLVKLHDNHSDPKVIVMGDFNDNPNDESVKFLTNEQSLFNPMETLFSYEEGSLNHKFKWNLFDQIMITTNFFETKKDACKFDEAHIFGDKFLTQYNGKFEGHPYRTYVGKKYKGGFSDHFPVFIILKW